MQAERPQVLTPPEGLRPAQLGIVLLGRVILSHVSATLIDIAQRGFLGIEEVRSGAGTDWLLTDLRDQAGGGGLLLGFEVTLLDGLFGHQPVVLLSEIGEALIPALNRFRRQLRRDAVRHGWLRRWHRDKRTPRGEQLLRQIQGFRRELRTLAPAGDSGVPAALAPYGMIFGLVSSPLSLNDGHDAGRDCPRETEAQWSQSDRFGQSWLAACAGLSAGPGHGHRSGTTQPGDFVHEWSAPSDHGSHGHDSGYGGYGDHGGGHHAGFDGGGHGGY
jgi:hypothetical protein